ncbi:MAG TPA: carboxylesterase family protein [Rhizomicrobium sp.]|nr:carboxylesterase family protein [Rhizomicrobium sp.]
MRRLLLAVAGIAALSTASFASDVRVTGGIVRGQDMPDGSIVFRGIAFAAPPVGKNRWRPPQPVIPWKGVRDASTAAAPCIQHDEGWNHADALAGKEDCLYLTIHAPKPEAGTKHPVFFWIHGGSNRAGSGYGDADSTMYTQGVVLVSINYRLGVFGFLAHPGLTAESPKHASGNYGIMDMIAALKWVKANIAKFGGDPANVTIGGQSAGSNDVGTLLFSPLAHGLFTKAVMESGPAGLSLPPRTLAENEKIGNDLESLTGTHGITALRALPADTILTAGESLKPPAPFDSGLIWGQQMIDGYVLREPPLQLLAEGKQAHVPLIIGDVTREFPFDGPADAQIGLVKAMYGSNADAALRLYGYGPNGNPPDDPVLGSVGTQVLADVIMRCPANGLAASQTAAGAKVWRYQFGLPRAGLPWPPAHNAELSYVFESAPTGSTFATWPPLQRYWANFAATGDPNGPDLPQWPSLGNDRNYLAFTPDGPKPGKDLRGPFCRLLTAPDAR